MVKMEESKYLEPKTSKSIEDLLKLLLKSAGHNVKKQVKGTSLRKIGNLDELYNPNSTAR